MTATVDSDWTVDEPDESVGIFGTMVMHDACGTEEPAFRVETHVRDAGPGTVTVTEVWECGECPARVSFSWDEPAD